MSFQDLINDIRAKTKREWEELVREFWTDFRIWLQENGEVAALCALIVGMIIAATFKYVFAISLLLAALAFVVWFYAESGDSSKPAGPDFPVKDSHSVNGAAKNGEDSKP